jgi:hypothetical protein
MQQSGKEVLEVLGKGRREKPGRKDNRRMVSSALAGSELR